MINIYGGRVVVLFVVVDVVVVVVVVVVDVVVVVVVTVLRELNGASLGLPLYLDSNRSESMSFGPRD